MSKSTTYIVNIKNYMKDDVIFMQGDESTCMYEVQQGRVGIFLDYGTDKEKKIAEIGPDRIFGEMGMVEGLPRSATAVALEKDTELAIITWEILGLYFKTKPSRVVQILQQTSDRLRLTTSVNAELNSKIKGAIASIEGGCSRYEAARILKSMLLEMDNSLANNK